MAFEHIPLTAEEYFNTKDGLTQEEELARIANRFGTTKEETLKAVVHAVYITGIGHDALCESIEVGFSKLLDEECIRSTGCNCDGTPIENDDIEDCIETSF